jgi:hypothetical protein
MWKNGWTERWIGTISFMKRMPENGARRGIEIHYYALNKIKRSPDIIVSLTV